MIDLDYSKGLEDLFLVLFSMTSLFTIKLHLLFSFQMTLYKSEANEQKYRFFISFIFYSVQVICPAHSQNMKNLLISVTSLLLLELSSSTTANEFSGFTKCEKVNQNANSTNTLIFASVVSDLFTNIIINNRINGFNQSLIKQ